MALPARRGAVIVPRIEHHRGDLHDPDRPAAGIEWPRVP
jgi:hypothetical protein